MHHAVPHAVVLGPLALFVIEPPVLHIVSLVVAIVVVADRALVAIFHVDAIIERLDVHVHLVLHPVVGEDE